MKRFGIGLRKTTSNFGMSADLKRVDCIETRSGWSNSTTPIIFRDQEGNFDAVKYNTSSTAPGTLELKNADLDVNGNDIVDSESSGSFGVIESEDGSFNQSVDPNNITTGSVSFSQSYKKAVCYFDGTVGNVSNENRLNETWTGWTTDSNGNIDGFTYKLVNTDGSSRSWDLNWNMMGMPA